MIVWKLVSPSPGMLVWTSSTVSISIRISSASVAFSSTASEVAPAGGMTTTCRIFSDPALMNCVGRSGTRASDATNRTPAPARTPHLVMRLRREKVIAGVYTRTQNERFGSPCSSTASETRLMNRYARTGTTVSATTSEASSANVTVRANGRNSWLTSPPTRPSGRNTPTVVRVAAVIAVATSRGPLRTAVSRSSPIALWR